MLSAPAEYAEALRGPHRRVARLDAYTMSGTPIALGVPITGGSVRADLTNRVTRSATFSTAAEFFPQTPQDPLSPFQAVVRISAGLALGTGQEIRLPVFTGRVYNASLLPSGTAQFRADDLSADVVAARFEQPERSRFGSRFATITQEVRRLIQDALPEAEFGTDDVDPARVPDLVWDEDRGQALDDLASAVGARWYALADGSFVLRRIDYAPGAVVQTFMDGSQGLMHRATVSRTRDGSANAVVVVSERLDGTGPVRVVARDNRLDSPTRYAGPFGKVVQVIKVQTPLTQNEARRLADAQLAGAVALTENWSSEVVADHRLELGDTVALGYRGLSATQVVDAITYPLDTRTPMRLESRGTVAVDVPGA